MDNVIIEGKKQIDVFHLMYWTAGIFHKYTLLFFQVKRNFELISTDF